MTPAAPDPAMAIAAVAGLARVLDEQGRRLAGLDELADQVRALDATVKGLCERLDVPGQRPTRPITWLGFPSHPADPDARRAAAALLGDLIEWMDTVYLRYPDAAASLPECWLWHPDVVEELLWLRHAWVGAYRTATSVAPAGDWHDRQRPGVVRRIKSAASTCGLESHLVGGRPRRAPLVGAVPRIAEWWVRARSEGPPAPDAAAASPATSREGS